MPEETVYIAFCSRARDLLAELTGGATVIDFSRRTVQTRSAPASEPTSEQIVAQVRQALNAPQAEIIVFGVENWEYQTLPAAETPESLSAFIDGELFRIRDSASRALGVSLPETVDFTEIWFGMGSSYSVRTGIMVLVLEMAGPAEEMKRLKAQWKAASRKKQMSLMTRLAREAAWTTDQKTTASPRAQAAPGGRAAGGSCFSRYRWPLLAALAAVVVLAAAILIVRNPGDQPAETPSASVGGASEALAPVNSGMDILNADAPVSVLFSAPTGSRDEATYVNGLDTVLAAEIDAATRAVDVAAFELDSPVIADALRAAHERGVTVRLVVDDEHGLDVAAYQRYRAASGSEREAIAERMVTPLDETLIDDLVDAGIAIVDDGGSAMMLSRFVIVDGEVVWMGSFNLTVNELYRNNNHFLRVRSQEMAANYQAEFDEMFERGSSGVSSPIDTPYPQVEVEGVRFEVIFAPEDDMSGPLLAAIESARRSIRFLTFSFTEDALGEAMLAAAERGVRVQGVFETTGSATQYSELTRLFCAGQNVRQDGNPFVLHYNLMILDNDTVILSSSSLSRLAEAADDNHLIIVHDAAIAAQYLMEYERRWSEANPPEGVTCP